MKTEGNLNIPWELHGCSDTQYAGDRNTQKTVTGYVVLINRVVATQSF